MTSISRHTYKAETDLGTDLSLTGGNIALDAGAIPHVTATATLAVEDVALLDELDPRDSRRIIVGATRDGHAEKVYTPWVEQRRNLIRDPRFTTPSNWQAQGATYTVADGVMDITVTTGATSNFIIPSQTLTGLAPGSPLSAGYSMTNLSARALSFRVACWNGGTYFYGPTVTLAPGESAVVGAPGLLASGSYMQPRLHTVGALVAGDRVLLSEPIAEQAAALGTFFYAGANPAGELERTRWVGAANASASVIETRTFIGLKWVPEDFRFFDLGLRSCSPNRADGTVTVDLASDEALLGDFAQLTDDETPRTLEASLRAVVNYVLAKIGAALEPTADEADVTAYWPVSLLNSNPAGMTNTNGYWAGAGASALTSVVVASPAPAIGSRAVRWTTSSGSSSVGVAGWDGVSTTKEGRVTPGRRYGTVVRMLSNPGRSSTVTLGFRDENGRNFSSVVSPAQVTSLGAWTEFYLNAEAPPGAAYAYVSVTTAGNSAGQNHWVQAILYEGRWRIPMFYGDSVGGGYTYAWAGDPNASPSERIPVVERDPESLVWPAGVSAMDFLHPVLLTTGLRLVCDEARRWTLRSEDYRAGGSQTWRYAVNITAADEKLSRDDESWFDAAVYVYSWTDADGIEKTRYDAFSLTGTPTKVLRMELTNTPYPGPGRAKHVVERAQGKGREVTIAGIPKWTEQTDQPLSLTLDGSPLQTGISARIVFDLDSDTVTVTSRTTDTPPYAWQLIPVGEEWLDSPPGASWIGEVI